MRTSASRVFFLSLMLSTAAAAAPSGSGLRIYSDELFPTVFGRVLYGFDLDRFCTVNTTVPCTEDADCEFADPNDLCGAFIDPLTPGTQTNIWDLVCDPLTPGGDDCRGGFWDFSGVNLANFPDLNEIASTTVPVSASETCAAAECGFPQGEVLSREDRLVSPVVPTISAFEFENRAPQDHTIWLRGAVRNEGVTGGGLGESQSRICYVGFDENGRDRKVVPLWQFQTCDGQGCYMQVGDAWGPENPTTGLPEPFTCEAVAFNTCNGTCGFACRLFAYGDPGPNPQFGGGHFGKVINEGTVKLPSGHIFRALVMRSNPEFRLALFSSCGNATQNVRNTLYLWIVPNLGTVVRLQARTLADSVKSFNAGPDLVSEMDVKFSLLPPLSLNVDAVTETSVELSWNPGAVTHRINGYRVYWDTDSGNASPYLFDSLTHSGQVTFDGPSATISGLTPGTTYYFTVTSVSAYTDPSSLVTTTYESTRYPTQLPAVPVDLPLEVQAATSGGGGPAGAVPDGDARPGTPLLLSKGTGGSVNLTWSASCVPGDDDYAVYEGALGSYGGHAAVTCSTAGATTTTFTPAAGNRFFLVVPRNGSAEGSYGLTGAGVERAPAAAACLPRNVGSPVCQ